MTPNLPLHELVRLCLDKNRDADWEVLLGRIQPLIARAAYGVAVRSGAVRAEDIDDIVQKTVMKLAVTRSGSMARAAFEGEGGAAAYIRAMAINAARDHFGWNLRHPETQEHELAVPLDQLATEPHTGSEWDLLLTQIDSALPGDERDRSVFWLYFLRGFSAKEISKIPRVGLSVKGVEALLGRLADTVSVRFGIKKKKKGNFGAGEY